MKGMKLCAIVSSDGLSFSQWPDTRHTTAIHMLLLTAQSHKPGKSEKSRLAWARCSGGPGMKIVSEDGLPLG